MVKRSTKRKVVQKTKEKTNPVADRLKVPVSKEQSTQAPQMSAVLEEYLGQQPEFTTSDEAVTWWTGKIAERFERNPKERAAMQEFLQLLVDTDPSLREQLLQEISGKKA